MVAGESTSRLEVERHLARRRRPGVVISPGAPAARAHEIDSRGRQCVPVGPVVLEHAFLPRAVVRRQQCIATRR